MERRMGGGGEIGEVIKVGSFRVDRDGLRIERIGFRVCGNTQFLEMCCWIRLRTRVKVIDSDCQESAHFAREKGRHDFKGG